MSINSQYTLLQSQKGSILLLSLVMLLLITVVGTGAISVTTLDTKMGANIRDRQAAFQAAEAGLFEAEDVVDPLDNSFPIEGTTAGFVSEALPDGWWASSSDTTWVDSGANLNDYQASGDLLFIIDQPIEKKADSMEKVRDFGRGGGGPVPVMRYYPLTSKGAGPGGAAVVLQSVYARKKYLNN